MSDTSAKLAEHFRKLAAEEVAMAELALTNEARARHYAKAVALEAREYSSEPTI